MHSQSMIEINLLPGKKKKKRAGAGISMPDVPELLGKIRDPLMLAAVGVYMVLSWDAFFTTFHRMFFEGDTWIFRYSDTLIRLFPIRFWQDVAATIVGLIMLEAVAVGVGAWMWRRRLLPPNAEEQ